ncbi:hypothetical protein MMC14_006042 [Varicellaria rhodocarpa]|nr:hypothetical protein [Varicellaria rhodocarpa]
MDPPKNSNDPTEMVSGDAESMPTSRLPGSFPSPQIIVTDTESQGDSSVTDPSSMSPWHASSDQQRKTLPRAFKLTSETDLIENKTTKSLKDGEPGERDAVTSRNQKEVPKTAPERTATPGFSSEKEVVSSVLPTPPPMMTAELAENLSTEEAVSPVALQVNGNESLRGSVISAITETNVPTSSVEDESRWSAVSPIEEDSDAREHRKFMPLQGDDTGKAGGITYPPNEGGMRTFYDSSSDTSVDGDRTIGRTGDEQHEGVNAMLAAAKSVRMNRPSRFSSQQAREVEDYFMAREKEGRGSMWERVGRERARMGIGLGSDKAESVLGEESVGNGNGKVGRLLGQEAILRNVKSGTGKLVEGRPRLQSVPQPSWLPTTGNPIETDEGLSKFDSRGHRRSKAISLLDALNSNPPDSTAPLSSPRSSTLSTGKRASFAPEPIDVHSKEKDATWERDGLISTPYPKTGDLGNKDGQGNKLGLQDGEEEAGITARVVKGSDDERKRFSMFSFMGGDREKLYGGIKQEPEKRVEGVERLGDVILTVVLYRPSNTVPRVGMVAIPRGQYGVETSHSKESGCNSWLGGKRRVNFDDEGLFKLMRSQYRRLRGGWISRFLDARGLKNISLLSYTHLSQLAARDENPVKRKTFHAMDKVFAEERMLELFISPRKGRGGLEWVEWVGGLDENHNGDVDGSDDTGKAIKEKEKIAVELVEGWNGGKIALAVGFVVFLSVAVVVLWIFLGVGGEQAGFLGFRGIGKEGEAGFRGAGGRVETGVLLGVLVLLMGWTGVAAWTGLSWFVT